MKSIFKSLCLYLISFLFVTSVNAASANIAVTSSANQIIVGKNVTVYVTISSSTALGSWEYTLNYDTSVFKLTSSDVGLHYASYVGNNNTKSVTYKYVFTALKSGSSKFYIDSSLVADFNENLLSVKEGAKTIKAWTYTEYQASLSKNNNLKSLSIDGYEISPVFNKDVLEYNVQVNEAETKVTIKASVEDKTASVNGTGSKEVFAGNNSFDIVVVAQNGNEKTYRINVEVVDKNPINVTVQGKDYNVIKLASNLVKPESYNETTVMIDDFEIPAFYSEITEFILVGLKDSEGNANLFIYDDGEYIKYHELNFGNITLYPLEIEEALDGYSKTKIKVQEIEMDALALDSKSRFKIINGLNVETKEQGLYLYDETDNSVIKYDDEHIKLLEEENNMLMLATLIFGTTTIISIVIIIMLLCKRKKKINNKDKKNKKTKADAKNE